MIGIMPNPTPRIGMSPVENTFGRAALLMLPSEHQHCGCVCADDDQICQDKHQDFETTAVVGNGGSIAGGGGGDDGDVMLECLNA
jgi:hypothetical protein